MCQLLATVTTWLHALPQRVGVSGGGPRPVFSLSRQADRSNHRQAGALMLFIIPGPDRQTSGPGPGFSARFRAEWGQFLPLRRGCIG